MARLYVPKPPADGSEAVASAASQDARSKPPPTTPAPEPSPPRRRPRRSSPTAQLEAELEALQLNAPPLSTDSAASVSDSESELRARPPALETIYRTPPKRTTFSRLVRGTDRRVQCSPEMGVVYRDVRRYVLEGEDDVTESSESEGSLAGFVVGDDEVEYESDAESGDESLLVGKKIWDVPLKRRTPARRRWEDESRDAELLDSETEEESEAELGSEGEPSYSEAARSPPRGRRISGKRQWSKVEVVDISDSESDAQSPFEKMPSESPFQSGTEEDSDENQSFVSAASVLTEKKVEMVTESDSEAELRAKPPSPGPIRKRIIRTSSAKSVGKDVVAEPRDDTMDTDSEAELRAKPPAAVQVDNSLEITKHISEVVLTDDNDSDSDVIFLGAKESGRKPFKIKKEPSPEPDGVGIKQESPDREVFIKDESPDELPEPDLTAAVLEYSPPRKTKPRPLSPAQIKREDRTPSPPFTKSTKKIPRIPATPFRKSDVNGNFWDIEAVNDWNDRHSPVKTVPQTPGTKIATSAPHIISDDEPEVSDSEDDVSSGSVELRSVRATTVEPKAPATRKTRKRRPSEVKFAAEQRAFLKRRPEIAESLVNEIDEKVADSYLSRFYANTGGIKVVWKRNFRTTAGMAHYGINRKRLPGGEVVEEPYANILLSEKLLLSEQKLIDTVAHEVCHLLAGVIGQSKISHGKVFREWGRRIEKALPGRNIKIETFHDYQTEKRYEWTCTNEACGYIYRRESKSIDITKFGCGVCKSKLAQTKPVPTQRKETDWQRFIKENMKRVKAENPKVPQKEIMGLLSKEFKAMKAKGEAVEKRGDKGDKGDKGPVERRKTLEVRI